MDIFFLEGIQLMQINYLLSFVAINGPSHHNIKREIFEFVSQLIQRSNMNLNFLWLFALFTVALVMGQ